MIRASWMHHAVGGAGKVKLFLDIAVLYLASAVTKPVCALSNSFDAIYSFTLEEWAFCLASFAVFAFT